MDFFTRNRNNPIARAELYQRSYIPPFQAEWQAEQMPRRIKTSFFSIDLVNIGFECLPVGRLDYD